VSCNAGTYNRAATPVESLYDSFYTAGTLRAAVQAVCLGGIYRYVVDEIQVRAHVADVAEEVSKDLDLPGEQIQLRPQELGVPTPIDSVLSYVKLFLSEDPRIEVVGYRLLDELPRVWKLVGVGRELLAL
jgi:hypothetical protein